MSYPTKQDLVLGSSNQILSAPGRHYNVEELAMKIQFSCPAWTGDRVIDVHLVKIYNTVTCYIGKIEGDEPITISPSIKRIKAVAGTLPQAHPTGIIPNRFLPMNSQSDHLATADDGYIKTFPILGTANGTGFSHHLVIPHYPKGHPSYADNGKIEIGFNCSTQGFQHSDAGTEPTCLNWITNSNTNEES